MNSLFHVASGLCPQTASKSKSKKKMSVWHTNMCAFYRLLCKTTVYIIYRLTIVCVTNIACTHYILHVYYVSHIICSGPSVRKHRCGALQKACRDKEEQEEETEDEEKKTTQKGKNRTYKSSHHKWGSISAHFTHYQQHRSLRVMWTKHQKGSKNTTTKAMSCYSKIQNIWPLAQTYTVNSHRTQPRLLRTCRNILFWVSFVTFAFLRGSSPKYVWAPHGYRLYIYI